ncbi:translational activator of GCN4, partial [Coemansia guatemalensis]
MSGNTDEAEKFAWKEHLSSLSKKITTASVKQRIAVLGDELQALVAANPPGDKELVGIILLLKKTVLLYVDRESRAAVLEVLKQLGDQRPEVFVKALATVAEPFAESLQPKKIADPRLIPTPMAGRFVLHSWITMGLAVGGKHAAAVGKSEQQQPKEFLLADAAWKRLVELEARLLWGIAPAQPQSDSKALSMSRTAHRSVWRMIREAPAVVEPMLEVLTAEENETAAVLLGNVISAAHRDSNSRKLVSDAKEKIVSYIDRVLICSKRPVSYSSIADLGCFLQHYVGADFDKKFRGSISKMLLRSPENVVPTCLWLLQGLGKSNVDITAMYLEVFADTLGKLLGGTNVEVRKSAAELLAYLANTPSTEEAALEATEKITKPLTLGRYPQPEQRALVYGVLRKVRAGPGNGWASSIVILSALEKMTTKDTQAVEELFVAMGAHVGVVMEHLSATKDSSSAEYERCVTAIKELAVAAQKGLALPDRAANARQGWAADALGEPLWIWAETYDVDAHAWMGAHMMPVLQTLVAKAQKAASSPLAGSAEAHVGLALALRMRPAMEAAGVDVAGLVKAVSVEKSLVLWDKVYHRLTRTSEYVWLLRCAQLLFQSGCDDSRLADLLLWTIRDNQNAQRETTQAGISALENMSRADAKRLWNVLGSRIFESMNTADQGGSGSNGASSWANILRAVASGAVHSEGDAASKARMLVALALACNHPAVGLIAGGSLWIALVQRAGVNPA